jgi:23S rRNA (uracil1939-C5)-methyltransferase
MSVKRGQEIELFIEKSALGAMGLCRMDGMAVFVEGAIPGDKVLARIARKKKSWALGRVLEIISPSADRVEAPCPFSGYCGGCKWQFLNYERQIQYKREHVTESLAHIAGIADVLVLPTLASPRIYGYRNKMEFSCSDRRWLLPSEMGLPAADGNFACGLHVPGTFDKVLDIDACLLQPEPGNSLLAYIKTLMRQSDLPAYGLKSHQGFWRFVVLRRSHALGQWMVNLVSSWDETEKLAVIAKKIQERFPEVVSVVNNITDRKSAVAVGDREVLLSGRDFISERMGPFTFSISANSFFQTNTLGAENLYNVVRDFAGLCGNELVLDLYCGTGTIALWLADQAKSVVGIEINPFAVADAQKNAEDAGVENCRFITGDIPQAQELKEKPDLIVTDPPRTGMQENALTWLAQSGVRRIIYVSCNPATLSRDLALLAPQYSPVKVQPVDMFPHTPHIEAVALLEKI